MFRRRNRGAEFRTLEATERYTLRIISCDILVTFILYTKRSIVVKDEIQSLFYRAGRGKRDTNSSFVGLISNVRPSSGASNPIESLSGRTQGDIQ